MTASRLSVLLSILLTCMCYADDKAAPATVGTDQVTIQLKSDDAQQPTEPEKFSARFAPKDLIALLDSEPDELPLPLRLEFQRKQIIAALERVSMQEVVQKMEKQLHDRFSGRYRPDSSLITAPVPADKLVVLDAPDCPDKVWKGPKREVTGFILFDITEKEYIEVAVIVMQTARQLIDSGDPICDRDHSDYYKILAEKELADWRDVQKQLMKDEQFKAEVRQRVAKALKLDEEGNGADWVRETRRFTYIIKEGKFIGKLQPLVEEINHDMEVAGFKPNLGLNTPGIWYDPDLQDVEILLPRPILEGFLDIADQLEKRMAEEHIISIEAVRLTDRDIQDGTMAARLNLESQGVHDPRAYRTSSAVRELGLNSLLAVANQNLQINTLEQIAAGGLPSGVTPVQIAPPTLPPPNFTREATTVGGGFSVGAEDLFFDGSEQSYGFSYISPDGVEHNISLDVADSLRKYWNRIERNLIVHKIKKTESNSQFEVPIGPNTKTFEGIAALISQQNQHLIVATGTGAISETDATAGTWLIIQNFSIAPIPGSSTTLATKERKAIRDKVLLTMMLRDPDRPIDFKHQLLDSETPEELESLLEDHYLEIKDDSVFGGQKARTYEEILTKRQTEMTEEARIEKKEKNSAISMSFYSSQGTIQLTPGETQLGDANDLTSFTTELQPNVVTPISSFIYRSGEGTKASSSLTGFARGESSQEEKTMTHLVIRARFPTMHREKSDRFEGRYLGYFNLPVLQDPVTGESFPFLSSSEHPLERLAKMRIGAMFDALQENRIRSTWSLFDPNIVNGTVSRETWEVAMTRLLLNRKIISDAAHQQSNLSPEMRQKFDVEVRTLLEYDDIFFDAPNVALSNMMEWNDVTRILLALNNSPDRFALERLLMLLDDLGETIVTDEYAQETLAVAIPSGLDGHLLRPLTENELRLLRRDVANHYLRFEQAYGDAFMESVSIICGLGTYRAKDRGPMEKGPFRGWLNLVVYDNSARAAADPEDFEIGHDDFMLLKEGGIRGGWFEPSMIAIENLDDESRKFVIRGKEVVERVFGK